MGDSRPAKSRSLLKCRRGGCRRECTPRDAYSCRTPLIRLPSRPSPMVSGRPTTAAATRPSEVPLAEDPFADPVGHRYCQSRASCSYSFRPMGSAVHVLRPGPGLFSWLDLPHLAARRGTVRLEDAAPGQCSVGAAVASSTLGVGHWRAGRRLASAQPLSAFPTGHDSLPLRSQSREDEWRFSQLAHSSRNRSIAAMVSSRGRQQGR